MADWALAVGGEQREGASFNQAEILLGAVPWPHEQDIAPLGCSP